MIADEHAGGLGMIGLSVLSLVAACGLLNTVCNSVAFFTTTT